MVLLEESDKVAQSIPKRKIKDSVFTNLFQDKKYLLQLYKALHPEDGDATEDEKNIVGQYIIFSKVYNEQRKLHGATKEAITETIRICKDRNVLKEYLENREQEVVDMMMTLFDDDQILKAYTKDIREETERKTAMEMIKSGKISIDEVSEFFPELLESDIKELEAEVLRLI